MSSKFKLFSMAALVAGIAVTFLGAPANAVGPAYVALGDSFSSGAGSGMIPNRPDQLVEDQTVYDPATNTATNQCLRSNVAYPQLLANNRSYSFHNVSCAGAVIDNILTTSRFGEAPQIDAVNADTQLVTLTISGNDIGFGNIIPCVITTECTTASPSIVSANGIIAGLQPRIVSVLNAIRDRAPSAKIALAGYPQIVPNSGQSSLGCIGWLSNPEKTVVNNIEQQVNGALSGAISQVGGNSIYVNPYAATSPFMGYDLVGLRLHACSLSSARMINGIRADFQAGSFHPNKFGQNSYFQLFNSAV